EASLPPSSAQRRRGDRSRSFTRFLRRRSSRWAVRSSSARRSHAAGGATYSLRSPSRRRRSASRRCSLPTRRRSWPAPMVRFARYGSTTGVAGPNLPPCGTATCSSSMRICFTGRAHASSKGWRSCAARLPARTAQPTVGRPTSRARNYNRCMSKAFTNEANASDERDDAPDEAPPLPAGTRNYMTPGGFARMKRELDQLVARERPELVATVAWAAGNGDRSENGDYIYGKKRLREIDRRIRFLV